jgi:hypothetical protein
VRSYRGGTPSDRWLINCSARRFRRSRYGWTNQVTSLIGMIPLGSSVAQEIQRLCRVAPTRSASSAGSNLGRVSRRASLGQPPSARAARDRSPDRGQDSLPRPIRKNVREWGAKTPVEWLMPAPTLWKESRKPPIRTTAEYQYDNKPSNGAYSTRAGRRHSLTPEPKRLTLLLPDREIRPAGGLTTP